MNKNSITISQKSASIVCVLFIIANLMLITNEAVSEYKFWTGGGDGINWSDPFNWTGGMVPEPTDSVKLNNLHVNFTYVVNLPIGVTSTVIAKIIIEPEEPNFIYLVLPSDNIANPGLTVGNGIGSPYDFVIHKRGVFRNSSGAASGSGVVLANPSDSIHLLDSALWIHNSILGTSGVTNKLSKIEQSRNGIFRYDTPTLTPYSINASGIVYGSLQLSGVSAGGGLWSKKYIQSGSNLLTVRGEMLIDEFCYDSTTMTNNMLLEGDLTIHGKFFHSPLSTQTIVLKGTQLQTVGGSISVFISRAVEFDNPAGFTIENAFYSDTVIMTNGNINTIQWLGVGYDEENTGILIRTGGIVTGQIERWYLAGTTSPALDFPVGTETTLKMGTCAFGIPPTTAGRIGMKYIDGTGYTDLPLPLDDGGFSVTRRSNGHWVLTSTFLVGGSVNLTFDGNGQSGINDPSNLRVVWSNNNGVTFSMQGTHVPGTGTIAKRDNIVFPFSMFYLGGNQNSNPMPVELNSSKIPEIFSLSQNYPNPFNPATKIDFEIPARGIVKLTVFDLLGREVAILVNETLKSGHYTFDFNASDLASGVYVYKLELTESSNNGSLTKKMMVIK